MRFLIAGAGAIGATIGSRMSRDGQDVVLFARGPHYRAMKEKGVRVFGVGEGAEDFMAHPEVVDDLEKAGKADVVFLGVKAHSLTDLAPKLRPVTGPSTVFVSSQNGIPWWYFQRHGGPFEGRRVESVDPDGAILRAIDPRRIVGCVVYPACELAAPGTIRHIEGDRFPLGELDGAETERVVRLAEAFDRAGLKAPVLTDVRAEIWLKLWGNLTFNPISALTHSTLVDICQYPLTRELATNMMREAESVANRLGITFRVSIEKRIAGAERVGKHKTSMLQDVEAGRDPEIDALVGAVIELGRLTGTPTPHIDAAHALVKLLGRTMQEERVSVRAHRAV